MTDGRCQNTQGTLMGEAAPCVSGRARSDLGVQVHHTRAITKRRHLGHAQMMQHTQHRIRHRRPRVGHNMPMSLDRASTVTDHQQGTAFVIVQIGIPHRRSIQNHRII